MRAVVIAIIAVVLDAAHDRDHARFRGSALERGAVRADGVVDHVRGAIAATWDHAQKYAGSIRRMTEFICRGRGRKIR